MAGEEGATIENDCQCPEYLKGMQANVEWQKEREPLQKRIVNGQSVSRAYLGLGLYPNDNEIEKSRSYVFLNDTESWQTTVLMMEVLNVTVPDERGVSWEI